MSARFDEEVLFGAACRCGEMTMPGEEFCSRACERESRDEEAAARFVEWQIDEDLMGEP